MDFVSVILFLVMYYLRPQEWLSILNAFRPVQLIMILALVSLIRREPKLRFRDLVQTPHDWLIVAYFLWTIFTSPTRWGTFSAIQSQILLYFVVVQSVPDTMKMKKMIAWWSGLLMVIAALAVSSEFGFDPFNSYDLTHGAMKGRLALHLSIFNNPNGLAHSIVPVIPMLFFLLFWKKTFSKPAILILALPLYCIYLTMSKGAFLCGFVTLLATLTFGRPRIVQIGLVATAGIMGYGALFLLPRMNELNKSKSDAAIQGRIAAYRFGLECMRTHTTGIGLGNFTRDFFRYGPLEYPEHQKRLIVQVNGRDVIRTLPLVGHHYRKATHGVYNQNGAELGRFGLFLLVGILYSCFRTLMTAKTADTEEERIRRILFAITLAYAVSGWMVDFTYRPSFFVMVATTGAFHRLLRRGQDDPVQENTADSAVPPWLKRPAPGLPAPDLAPAAAPMPALAMAGGTAVMSPPLRRPLAPAWAQPAPAEPAAPAPLQLTEDGEPVPVMPWKKIGPLDIAAMVFMTWAVIRYWQHLIAQF